MTNLIDIINHDLIKPLLEYKDKYLNFLVQSKLLDNQIQSPNDTHEEVKQILKKQQDDGSWIYKNKTSKIRYPSINHELFEIFKAIRLLVGKYGLDRSNEQICKAVEYILSCQTSEGDIRGILGNQYMPYYCGLLLELSIKAGYTTDNRIAKAMNWLIEYKQNDNGWVIPMQIPEKINVFDDDIYSAKPILPDKAKPSSHMTTGMVLRAFSTHPDYRKKTVSIDAAKLLKERFFKYDKYNNRKHPDYWVKFEYPYWWTTILSSLDSLYFLGFRLNDKDIEKAIEWLLINQKEDGLWGDIPTKGNIDKYKLERAWISYDICRLLKLYSD